MEADNAAPAARLTEGPIEAPTEAPKDAPAAAKPVTAPPNPAVRRGIDRRQAVLIGVVVAAVAIPSFRFLSARSDTPSRAPAPSPASALPPAAARPSSTSKPRIDDGQKWSTENRAHWLGERRRGAAFELPADNIVQTWFGPVRPTLVVRCIEKTTQAFVYVGSPTRIEPRAEGKTVTVSLDDEPVRTEHWPDADDHDALFAPDGGAFTQRLLQGQTLRFGYSPHNAQDVVAHFNVRGLAELIEPAAKECGWTK